MVVAVYQLKLVVVVFVEQPSNGKMNFVVLNFVVVLGLLMLRKLNDLK